MDKGLLNIIACPKCKGKVEYKNMFLVCGKCKLAYPVLDKDIPDMLIEDACKLDKAKKAGFKHRERL